MSRMRVDNQDISDAHIFETLLENFPDIIHSVDDDGKIVLTNNKASSLLGYSREELIGMKVRDIYAPEIFEKLDVGFDDLKKKGDVLVESILQAKDGTKIPVEIRSFSIYDDDGTFLRTFSILRDIRPIKELQNSLVHAGRLAAIGEMASGVAHDINNPLTVIMMTNQLIERAVIRLKETGDAGLMDKVSNLASDVNRASKSIQKLVDHLRNFSRGVAEEREVVDLHDTLSDALFITQNRITSNCALASCDVEKGKHFANGSPNQLEQVFVNLISNACDAMSEMEGERKIFATVSACERDGDPFWKCDVSDTGSGIPNDAIDEIFQSFFTTKEKGKGTGLGLAIVRGIVREHEGDIEVASELGKGTTFSVYLPIVQNG